MTQQDQPGEGGFHRVHPLSPFVRGGLIAVGVLGYLVSQEVDRLTGPDVQDVGEEAPFSWLVQVGAVGLVILGAVGLGLLSWWFTRYRLGPQNLEIRTGWLNRQHREVRYDRIQAVDLVRPLLARLTGLAEVRVESAGGSDSHVAIAYLRQPEAEAVRARLLGLAAHARETDAPEAPAATTGTSDGPTVGGSGEPAEPLLRVPLERLVGSVLLSADTVAFGILLLFALGLLGFGLAPALSGLLPPALITGGRSLMRLTRWYGTAVARRGSTVTIERGLTDTRSSSVPLHRVQAVQIDQPLLWRSAGWWSLKVNVAGATFGSADSDGSGDLLVPVATTGQVLTVLQAILGDRETTEEVAALVRSTPPGFLGQPPAARWLDPLAHQRIGALIGGRALLTRGGWAGRWLQVVPFGRVQSITLRQGPLERRLGLADLFLVSTVGPVTPRVRHLAEAHAEHLAVVVAGLASRS
ncbi:PH domain-containing protein, partial [Janibacter corallicola]|uniref:PH domain-containing protein n=1 Tax=Janibacter corallicola TaxID=415212 RepID=UPI00082D64CD